MADIIHRTTRDAAGKLLRRYSVNTPSIDTNDWLVNPDLSGLGGVDEKYWKVTGAPPGGTVEEMTQGEKDSNDATILAAVKTAKIALLRSQAVDYLNTRYDIQDREFFHTLIIDAQISSKTNRRAYLASWFAWMEDAVTEVRNKIVDVNTATTEAAVAAVALDGATLTAADPAITVGGALAITD